MAMKAMVYTSFALLASALLLSLALVPLSTPEEASPANSLRIGQSSFFLDSVLSDLDRSLELSTRRALTSSTNYVLVNNESLKEPSENISSALRNGTISGEELEGMENVSLDEWSSTVSGIAESSGYELSISLRDYSFNATTSRVRTSYTVDAVMEDPVTEVTFNRTRRANSTTESAGLDDPLVALESGGALTRQYRECGFSTPLQKLAEGVEDSNDTVRGRAVVNPPDASAVSSSSEKLLVVDDVDSYPQSEVNSFRGVVSRAPNSSGGYTVPYVFDTGTFELGDGQTVLLHQEEVWRTNLVDMFDGGGCYVPDPVGPDPVDRLGGELVNSDGTGLATVLETSKLPPDLQRDRSSIGYVYFNQSGDYGGTRELVWFSEEYEWFRLDQDHVDRWSAGSLVK